MASEVMKSQGDRSEGPSLVHAGTIVYLSSVVMIVYAITMLSKKAISLQSISSSPPPFVTKRLE